MMATPFVAQINAHIDSIVSLCAHPTQLSTLLSCSADGEVKMWDMQTRASVFSAKAHEGFTRSICFLPRTQNFLSVGDDKLVKMWSPLQSEPLNTWFHKSPLTGVHHHRQRPVYATSSGAIDIWDHSRSEPISTMSWGAETISTVKFNQVETSILASCGSDRTVCLYDIRTNVPVARSILAMRSNAIAWNPMEAFNFTVANEDHNLYTFDMRNLSQALNILVDHVSAVMDVNYSPTGEEIVSAGYDKTIRIFNARQGRSREVYHTKRMQRVFSAVFSGDSKYIFSGSDDGNVRIWKTKASERIGPMNHKERQAMEYNQKLKERYEHVPEVRKILKKRHVPKPISSAQKIKRIQIDSRKEKEERRIKHSKKGSVVRVPERKKHVLAVEQ